jgi:Fe-S oxidoreductase
MASYKAEFLSHYYERHARPLQAHSMGRIGEWAPLAGRFPRVANFLTQAPGFSALAKRVAGIAPERSMPRFAQPGFRTRFAARPSREGDPVLLWVDTFTQHFRPETGIAAVEVLEAAGCRVEIPRQQVCCGRPYYDFGMLDSAKRALERVMAVLGAQIDAGVAVVGLEPSCVAVFRDELLQLFPDDARAQRLARQTVTLGEFLARRRWNPPRGPAQSAMLHGHCHQKSLIGTAADVDLLAAAGIAAQAPDTGCCGMAGAYGFKPEHYATSQKIGERVLLPAVREATPDTLIIADGFSCREQIEQSTGRATFHLAEALAHSLPPVDALQIVK